MTLNVGNENILYLANILHAFVPLHAAKGKMLGSQMLTLQA